MLDVLIPNRVYYKIFDRSNGSVNNECRTDKLLILQQVHKDHVVNADLIDDFQHRPEADAAVTTKKDIILSIQTADCVPVLLASEDGSIIGAAHCGWKGTRLGIIKKLIDNMKSSSGAVKFMGIIGPSIQQFSYEVDKVFYEDFISLDQLNQKFFISSKHSGHYMFDLPGLVRQQLEELDINVVHHISEDTYSMPDKYPSYRRACHKGVPNNYNEERILSIIMMGSHHY